MTQQAECSTAGCALAVNGNGSFCPDCLRRLDAMILHVRLDALTASMGLDADAQREMLTATSHYCRAYPMSRNRLEASKAWQPR